MKPQSMEEKISYRLFFMGFVGLVCTAVLCLFVFHKAFREQAWTSLEHQADLVSAGYEQLSSPDQLSVFVNGDLRITLIAADGSVVFESATDQQMENHLSRPEIQQAMREGVGRNCRDSQTMGYETYYYAMLLPGGDILRDVKLLKVLKARLVDTLEFDHQRPRLRAFVKEREEHRLGFQQPVQSRLVGRPRLEVGVLLEDVVVVDAHHRAAVDILDACIAALIRIGSAVHPQPLPAEREEGDVVVRIPVAHAAAEVRIIQEALALSLIHI